MEEVSCQKRMSEHFLCSNDLGKLQSEAVVKNPPGEVEGSRTESVDKHQPGAELNLRLKQGAFHESAQKHLQRPYMGPSGKVYHADVTF